MNFDQFKYLINELTSLPNESEWVEFKVNNKDPQKIGENISAISNSASLLNKKEGYIVYGIENNTHKVVGTTFDPTTFKIKGQELKNYLETQIDPPCNFEFIKGEIDGFHVVVAIIEASISYPTKFKKVPYIRVGSYTKKLQDHPQKEKRLWTKLNSKSFEVEDATGPLSIEETLGLLNYPDVFRSLDLGLPTSQNVIVKKLEEEKLIRPNHGKYIVTNLGALLFAYDLRKFDKLSRKSPRVIQYKKKDKLQTIKENEFYEGYANSFLAIVEYINDQLPRNEEIGQTLRADVRVYPEIAIRELVANAMIHQDLNVKGTGVMIEIFENRIEITNPGSPIIDVQRFIDHSPESRNELLARLMRRMRICEERGSGIDKVISAIEAYQLPAPEFIEGHNYTRVKIFKPKSLRQMTPDDKIRATYQHCVLKYITSNYMTNMSLRKRFGIDDSNYPQASRIIKSTIDSGYIKPYEGSKTYIPFWAE